MKNPMDAVVEIVANIRYDLLAPVVGKVEQASVISDVIALDKY
ncbi:MAG: hypothetical protein OXN27_07030 [Candidatus Poribacteria bacterium]|nr:hypothetical protein [Candidatus Poribacteria bacterium]